MDIKPIISTNPINSRDLIKQIIMCINENCQIIHVQVNFIYNFV